MDDLGGAGKEDAVAAEAEAEAAGRGADHLVVMVHGIVGSAADWKFGAEQFNKLLLDKVIVHCSNCNMHKTLDGIDVMGERLAQEVIEETNRRPQVKKISFVAHSVGGLVARYAIGILYRPPKQTSQDPSQITGKNYRGTIHGLEAVNFITVASPHLGSRGNKQVPCLLGVTAIENFACCIIHMIFGKTGKHLFLNDNDDGKPPLLQRMVDDWGDRHFMSALQAFKRRVTYSNVGHDHIVGWRTSSIRRSSELPEWVDSTGERYPHIVNEEQSEAENVNQYFDIATTCVDNCTLEERLLRGLRRVSWEKVDVSFHNSKVRSAAHSVIQVKDPIMHAEGADVIQHMIDNFVIKGNPEFWA